MKILYLADARDIHTLRLAGYFANLGNEVHVASFRSSTDLDATGSVHTHLIRSCPFLSDAVPNGLAARFLQRVHLGSTFFDPLYATMQVKDLISEVNPDIMHCQSIVSHTIVGWMCGFHPMVVSPMGSDIQIYPRQSRIVRLVVKSILSEADALTAEGERLRDEMVRLGAETAKIRVINRGVDRRLFNPSQRDDNLKELLGIRNSPTVISTRRMGAIHDVATLLRAAVLILDQAPDVKFILVGDGEQKHNLEKMMISLGLSNSVKFVGMIRHEEVPRYLASSDIYVSTSLSDGCSVSTLEALACGLAPVVSDVGNHNTLIEDGVNGFIVPPGNAEILAERITFLLKNDEVRSRFGRADHGIGELADFETEMAKMNALYTDVTSGVVTRRQSVMTDG